MAYSYSEENLANNFDQWTFRQSFDDDSSWMSSIQETETLTKALQQSFSGGEYSSAEEAAPPLAIHHHHQQQFLKPESTTATPTVSGSDPETTTTSSTLKQQQRRNNNNHHHQILKGKISKRKSRATNRSPITFITADPMNFRQMVQQVTGIRIGAASANGGGGGGGANLQMPVSVLKPEAKRPVDLMLMNGGYTLPTLDTSAYFLLEQQQQQQQQQQLMGSNTSSTVTSPTHVVSYHAPVVASQVNTSFDFDTLQSFPTLESWGVI